MFKTVKASEVVKGQYVLNVGVIDTVRVYPQEQAIIGKTTDDASYKMWDAVQRETAIQCEVDKVSIETPDRVIWHVGHKVFRFDLDREVKVWEK